MLYNWYGTDVFKGTDANKTSKSKECDICHYWCFLDKGFTFQPDVCNGCHYVSIMSVNWYWCSKHIYKNR